MVAAVLAWAGFGTAALGASELALPALFPPLVWGVDEIYRARMHRRGTTCDRGGIMRVRDIMTSAVHVVAADAPVESAADLMTMHAVTALPVLDGDGLLVGMVSDSDLLWHRVPAEPTTDVRGHPDTDPAARPGLVMEIMSEYPLATTPGADVADVAQVMLDHDVRSLPVMENRTVIGIVSRRDIVKAMVRDDHVLTADVQQRLDEYSGRRGWWTATVQAGTAVVTGPFPNEQQRRIAAVLARAVPGVAAVRLDPRPGTNGTVTRSKAVMA
ncbi:CBS domain-containing protein [Actinoplanes sp. NPDC024001]|uniref:CBS domain-containing protein n=1 Tax=Actinoplanes sp. NPDC024001 TaxID=3154598 RepID=UPI0033EF04E2